MILDIEKCIPTMEELKRRANPKKNRLPSREAMDEMALYLSECGYNRINDQVYDTILRFGAAELEGKNGRGLFLRGPCGIGKSFGILCLAAKFQWPVITAKQLQAAFSIADSDQDFFNVVDAYNFGNEPQTIVIDDAGTEDCPVMKYGTATNVIADALDRRYYIGFMRQGVRTIVTCNLSDEQLRERYGVRIDDRMNEMFEFATVAGESLRN